MSRRKRCCDDAGDADEDYCDEGGNDDIEEILYAIEQKLMQSTWSKAAELINGEGLDSGAPVLDGVVRAMAYFAKRGEMKHRAAVETIAEGNCWTAEVRA